MFTWYCCCCGCLMIASLLFSISFLFQPQNGGSTPKNLPPSKPGSATSSLKKSTMTSSLPVPSPTGSTSSTSSNTSNSNKKSSASTSQTSSRPVRAASAVASAVIESAAVASPSSSDAEATVKRGRGRPPSLQPKKVVATLAKPKTSSDAQKRLTGRTCFNCLMMKAGSGWWDLNYRERPLLRSWSCV